MADASHLAILDTASKIAITIIGLAWTLLTYVRGRTFRRRLDPKITGQIFSKNDVHLLLITVTVKNVGLSRANLYQRGTWIKVFRVQAKDGASSWALPEDNRLLTAPIFQKHSWVEPGEEVHDVFIVQLPQRTPDDVAIRLNLRVLSQEWRWPTENDSKKHKPPDFTKNWEDRFWRDLAWNAEFVVPLEVPPSPSPSEPQPASNAPTSLQGGTK
jgi:hypothetical protein